MFIGTEKLWQSRNNPNIRLNEIPIFLLLNVFRPKIF